MQVFSAQDCGMGIQFKATESAESGRVVVVSDRMHAGERTGDGGVSDFGM